MTRLIGFGASSMQGVDDSQGGFFSRLERKLAEAGNPHACLNYGVAGDTTPQMIARLAGIREHLPARSIIFLGSNDLPREPDSEPHRRNGLADYSRHVTTIVEVLGGKDSIFVAPFSICPLRTGVEPATFARYMEAALNIAAAHGMTTWDLYTESLPWGDRYLAPDGMHYQDAGHELIANRLLTML